MDRSKSVIERPVVFGEAPSLIGNWTRAVSDAPERPAVVMVTAGVVHRAGPWRLYTQLARRLAEEGFSSFRFDLAGVGDSERRTDDTSLGDSVAHDLGAALTYLENQHGVEQVVLLGLCSGAHDALVAAQDLDVVMGVALLDLPLDIANWKHRAYHLRNRVLDGSPFFGAVLRKVLRIQVRRPKRRRAGPRRRTEMGLTGIRPRIPGDELASMVRKLLDRDARLLFLFTSGLEWNYNHRSQFKDAFPSLSSHGGVTDHFLPKADHTLTDVGCRAAARERVVEWLLTGWGGGSSSRERGIKKLA